MNNLRERGQSLIEYILLLGVVVTLAFTVFQMQAFKDYIGPDSKVIALMRSYLEYNYRHGGNKPGNTKSDSYSYSGNHNTYYNSAKGSTHFFGLSDKYP